MVRDWIRWVDDRIGPQDPDARERYNRARGVFWIAVTVVAGVVWLLI